MSPRLVFSKIIEVFTVILFLLIFILPLTVKINLTTADLGRHIKNGETLLKDSKILHTNYYSYTQPDFPTTYHHLGFGVLCYIIYVLSGFVGLSCFNIVLLLLTFCIFFKIMIEKIGKSLGILISLLAIPVLALRTEVRPENFSYFFSAVFFFILLRYKENRISYRWLFLLPILEIFWVNLHLYFFLGPVIIGLFLFEKLFTSGMKSPAFQKLSLTLIVTVLATLLNPNGFQGAIYFLTVASNYGFNVAENQPVWVLEKMFNLPAFWFFKILFTILVLSFIGLFTAKNLRREFPIANLCLSILFSIFAWFMTRNLALFVLFSLSLIAINFNLILKDRLKLYGKLLNTISFGIVLGISLLIVFKAIPLQADYQEFGLGLSTGNEKAAEFFKKEKIKGPIFNNYDIGGYLIFYLFPEERVFVDNRPEAYTKEFFNKVYIPLQVDEKMWEQFDGKYNMNVIYFNILSYSAYGKTFLTSRMNDAQWAPVYTDKNTIIFLKRNLQNQKVIANYEIPKEFFMAR